MSSAARNRVKAAFFDVKVAELTRLPGISINAAGGTLLDPNLALLGTSPEFLRIGVNLLQPIFAGGAIDANIARMTAKQAAAVAEYGQTVLEAFREVETALANETGPAGRTGQLAGVSARTPMRRWRLPMTATSRERST